MTSPTATAPDTTTSGKDRILTLSTSSKTRVELLQNCRARHEANRNAPSMAPNTTHIDAVMSSSSIAEQEVGAIADRAAHEIARVRSGV